MDKKNEKFRKKEIFKYNEDDILEILTEYLAENMGFETFGSKAMIIGTPGKDLRLIAVIGELDDESVDEVDLLELDMRTEYNGSHPPTFIIRNESEEQDK
ncbi:hypothetical protein AB6A23_09235 [Paenibacillus tarimensis]